MKKLLFILLSLMLFSCQKDLEQVHLEVEVSSGITGVSLEGYEVWLYGPKTMTSTIDAEGKAYFDFEAPEGETYLVKFMNSGKNFNPQGIPVTSMSTILSNEKLEDQITVGNDFNLKLVAIPCTDLTISFSNELVEAGDSLSLVIEHELFTIEHQIGDDQSGAGFQFSGPIGNHNCSYTVYTSNDTSDYNYSFNVTHQESYRKEIGY